MKTIKVVKASKTEIKPFVLDNFILDKAKTNKIEKISKKELAQIAQDLNVSYTKKELIFAKKILTAYLDKKETI